MDDPFNDLWYEARPDGPGRAGSARGELWQVDDALVRLSGRLQYAVHCDARRACDYRWAVALRGRGRVAVGVRCWVLGLPGPTVVVDVEPAALPPTGTVLDVGVWVPALSLRIDPVRLALLWMPQRAEGTTEGTT